MLRGIRENLRSRTIVVGASVLMRYVAGVHNGDEIIVTNKRRKVTSPIVGIDATGALCRIPEGAVVDLLSAAEGQFIEVLWQARICRVAREDLEQNTTENDHT